MLLDLRLHSRDPHTYADLVHNWTSIVDAEQGVNERSVHPTLAGEQPRDIVARLYGCESSQRFKARLSGLSADDALVAACAAVNSEGRASSGACAGSRLRG